MYIAYTLDTLTQTGLGSFGENKWVKQSVQSSKQITKSNWLILTERLNVTISTEWKK